MRTQIELPPIADEQLKMPERTIVGFLGPKNFSLLEGADASAHFETGFKEDVDFGHLPLVGLSLSIIGKPLLWLLGKIHKPRRNGRVDHPADGDRQLLTLYWTTRSMRSMKAMAAMSPQVQENPEEVRRRQAARSVETMALYKTHGIRPLAGCAPMFLRSDLERAVHHAVGDRRALPPAVHPELDPDLTNTDPMYILPVALFITMFAQARLNRRARISRARMMQYACRSCSASCRSTSRRA